MSAQLEMQNDVIRRNHAMRARPARSFDPHRGGAPAAGGGDREGRALGLDEGPASLGASDEREVARADARGQRQADLRALGRASVADAFRRDLLRLARLVRRFILEPHARRRRRRIAIAQLRSLDDHLLADIGLTRGQIELAVDGMLARRGKHALAAGRPVLASRGRPGELPLAA